MEDVFMTIKEACKFLDITEATLHKYFSLKKLTKFKKFNKTFLLREEVEKLNQPQPVKNE